MNDRQTKEFDATKECNFAIAPPGIGRFRVSAFVQQAAVGCVIRLINAKIPTFEELDLPPILKEVVLSKRGLVIVVGGTGSGKSTSLAAMVGYRNEKTRGHIVTIEDPVEYVHPHKGCVITHREVGVDTDSWHAALKNTLRQAPDVILIGEIRDRETMEYGIQFAETGHLVLATLHANSSNQALDRIINFFPDERREQLLMDLSLNIRALISQRLIPREAGAGRIAAMEIMLNSPLIQDLIFKGEVAEIKEVMSRSNRLGMKTFDQALFELYETGFISYEDALRNADSKNELRLRIKLESKREQKNLDDGGALQHRRGRGGPQSVNPAKDQLPASDSRRGSTLGGHGRRGHRAPPDAQHQAAVQADGGEEGLGPVLHLQRAHQDQDRGPDPPGQQAGADPGDGAPDRLRADDARAARVLPARAGDRLRDLRARPRALPRQRLHAARLPGHGDALHHRRHAAARSRSGCRTILHELVMLKRGLILMVGATGSGKSTTLAAMINYRNENSSDHIVTIEDPIEFLHTNKRSIVNQREVGLDTKSYARALRGVVRAAPDVILIGEIRDQESMEAAINLAGTGHLVLATLHANNCAETLDRIINMFPREQHKQIFLDLSQYLRAILAQRLVMGKDSRRVAAVEVMINTPHIGTLVKKGDVVAIKEAISASGERGIQSFDVALHELFKQGRIDLEEALLNADSRANLEAKINFG